MINPEAHASETHLKRLLLLIVGISGLYFTLVSVPLVGGQIDGSDRAMSRLLVTVIDVPMLVCLVAACAVIITDKLHPESKMIPVWQRIMDASARISAFSTSIACVVALIYGINPENDLFSMRQTSNPLPFILHGAALSLMYTMLTLRKWVLPLVGAQAFLAFCVLERYTATPASLALTSVIYAALISSPYLLAEWVVVRGIALHTKKLDDTLARRGKVAHHEDLAATNARINALVHDYVIAVAVTVGRGIKGEGEKVAQAAKRALEVIYSIAPADQETVESDSSRAILDLPERLDANHLFWILSNEVISRGFTFHIASLLPTIFTGQLTLLTRRIFRRPNMFDGSASADLILAVREAMRNVEKHTRATKRQLILRAHPWRNSQFSITIQDNGPGFDPAKAGMGIFTSIVSRIERIGGKVQIETGHGRGTAVHLFLSYGNMAASGSARTLRLEGSTPTFTKVLRAFTTRLLLLPIPVVAAVAGYLFSKPDTNPFLQALATTCVIIPLLAIALSPAQFPKKWLLSLFVPCYVGAPLLTVLAGSTYHHTGAGIYPYTVMIVPTMWLVIRDRKLMACILAALGCICTIIPYAYLGYFTHALLWALVHTGGMSMFFLLTKYSIDGVFISIQAHEETQALLKERGTNALEIIQLRRRRFEAVRAELGSFLSRLAEGEDPTLLQDQARVVENQLRDSIRAAGLMVTPLVGTVRAARMRGAHIRLMDDSAGRSDLSELVKIANDQISKAGPDDTVTVRALPAGRSYTGTVVVNGNVMQAGGHS